MTPIPIHDSDDARVADYRQIRERDLTGRRGLFVAEGAVVLNVLASPRSRCRAVSALIAEQRVETLRPVLEMLDAPVYAAGQGVMDAVAGFPIHRGILALGEKPAEPDLADLLTAAPDDALVAATFRESKPPAMGMPTVRQRAVTAGANPGPSAPRIRAARPPGRTSGSRSPPEGLSASREKPAVSSASIMASGSSPVTNGVRRAAPTDTRMALRYSGSQQWASSSTAWAPKAAALRKMPPMLS